MSTSNSDTVNMADPTVLTNNAGSIAAVSSTVGQCRQLNWNLFQECLIHNLRDGVMFVDPQGTIRVWNSALEVMTGMTAAKVDGMPFVPSLLQLSDPRGNTIGQTECPLSRCLRTGDSANAEFRITGRSGREAKVEITFTPVKCADGLIHGAIVVVHDYTMQLDLQRQLKDLYEISTHDALTQIANRSEFERVLDEYVRAHKTTNFVCSLIVCDIDFFKQINDNYNHHIGDQALVAFASLLKKFVRAKDVVARYGGEEFVILCASCDAESAVQRAEEIRLTLTRTPQPMLDGKCITASFGVSELRATDSPTDLFVRADTALLQAKEAGRNQVINADVRNTTDDEDDHDVEAVDPVTTAWKKLRGQSLISEEFKTLTPMSVLIAKLRGYILETDAELGRIEPDSMSMTVQFENKTNYGVRGNFHVDIELQVRHTEETIGRHTGTQKSTFIRITIREAKRKWFATNAVELAPFLLREIRDYLMISDEASRLTVEPVADPTIKR